MPVPVRERRRRHRRRSFGEAAHLGDAALHLRSGEVAAGSRLRALAELEVERLDLGEHVPAPAEPGRGELVEVARVLALFFGEHAALARADTGARELRAPCQCRLRLLRQRAERHVGDEQRHVEPQRSRRVRSDAHLVADGHLVEQRESRELRGHELDRVPARELLAGHAHRGDEAVVADLREAVRRELVYPHDVGLFDRAVRIGVEALGTRRASTAGDVATSSG